MRLPYAEFDLTGLASYPLASRKSKARVEDFARAVASGDGIRAWMETLPSMLAASDFKAVVERIRAARAADRPVIWGLGAHVIKTGLAPVLIDLMERGYVSALATNGAGIIHDFEIALSGATSEDVDEALGPGRFGMAEETGTLLNRAINEGVAEGLGIGQAVGRFLTGRHQPAPAFGHLSLICAAARLGIPLTVHVAIGTDIIHMHPSASGAALGEGSLRDFRYFVSNVAELEGGVFLNCGIRRHPTGSISEGRRLVAQPRPLARRADDGQPRFHPPLPPHDQRGLTSDRGDWKGLLACWPSRADDSAAGRRADRCGFGQVTHGRHMKTARFH